MVNFDRVYSRNREPSVLLILWKLMSQQIRNLQRNAELEKTENRGREIPRTFREEQTMRAERGAIPSDLLERNERNREAIFRNNGGAVKMDPTFLLYVGFSGRFWLS